MKIEGTNTNSLVKETYVSKQTGEKGFKEPAFDSLLHSGIRTEVKTESKIPAMIEHISTLKQQLEHDLSVVNLDRYKEALRSFLQHYTQNELTTEHFYVKDSRTFVDKRVGIIRNMDEKLGELTSDMLETNQGHLDTLNKIGELQGLIVNLFL